MSKNINDVIQELPYYQQLDIINLYSKEREIMDRINEELSKKLDESVELYQLKEISKFIKIKIEDIIMLKLKHNSDILKELSSKLTEFDSHINNMVKETRTKIIQD
jgi:methyl coenzyme M reductase subunit C-like uncharacterized protein (methanogenesis marker protein 7)